MHRPNSSPFVCSLLVLQSNFEDFVSDCKKLDCMFGGAIESRFLEDILKAKTTPSPH